MLPLGFHVIPNIGRLATEFALHGIQDPGKYVTRLMPPLAEAFNPVGGGSSLLQVVAPTSMDPLAAVSENKDRTGRALRAKASTRRPRATALAKDTASALAGRCDQRGQRGHRVRSGQAQVELIGLANRAEPPSARCADSRPRSSRPARRRRKSLRPNSA